MIMEYIFRKISIVIDKFVEGFIFGCGLYAFYRFAVWMGWF